MRKKSLLAGLILLLMFSFSSVLLKRQVDAESNNTYLLKQLSMEEKVGQLFLVTFKGRVFSQNSDIYRLITQYHIGGVLLKRENGNWRSGAGEADAVLQLTNGLQQIEADAAAQQKNGNFLPLLIALSQPGDGYPFDQLATDLTQLPSQMAIGATWEPARARDTGRVLGEELSSLGVNLLLGPSLDVLERPNPGTSGDLGVRVFGGDPFWVWKMGQAYIQGVQEGSRGRIAVVATHFPGIGGSDRSPDEEVASVRKAMDDLRQIELAPFAAVTDGVPGNSGVTDALLVSHIRYQGLQGNIRASIRPVSLDPTALQDLMNLQEFSAWRAGGGVTISESLGTQSVRKFYDPTGVTFYNQYIALNAFQAGNDILQLSNFYGSGETSETQTIEETIKYFLQKYQTDTEFAAHVDEAVVRILALKRRLNPQLYVSAAIVSADNLATIGKDYQLALSICKDGASLISPSLNANGKLDLEPPTAADRIIILTDSRQLVPCPGCAMETDLSPTAFSETILRLYGPAASGFVQSSRISAFALRDLYGYLQENPSPDLENALTNATIIVGLIRSPVSTLPETSAFQTLLAQRPDIVRNKRIVVFGLEAPYYLDSTEISKLDAYFVLYSKTDACIETAARLLYRDFTPLGASPVSVDGVGYDLLTELSPDPDQMIQITVGPAGNGSPGPTPTPVKTPTNTSTPRAYRLGDSLALIAGPILDHNQHSVPDGTVIRFQIDYPTGNIPPLYLDTTTKDGVGTINYVLDREGEIQISAVSEPAQNSTIVKLSTGEQPIFITPTRSETTSAPIPTTEQLGTQARGGAPGTNQSPLRSGMYTLGGMILLLGILTGAGVMLSRAFFPSLSQRRIALCALVGGLTGYDYIAMGMPGADWLSAIGGQWMSVLCGAAGCILGIVLTIWLGERNNRLPKTVKTD